MGDDPKILHRWRLWVYGSSLSQTARFENDRPIDHHGATCRSFAKKDSRTATLPHHLDNIEEKLMAKKTATFGCLLKKKSTYLCIFSIVEFWYSNNFCRGRITLFEILSNTKITFRNDIHQK